MVKQAEQNSSKPYLRLAGFVLAIAFGVIAFILSEPAAQTFLDIANVDIPFDLARGLVGITIFTVLLLFSYFLFAIFAPKDKRTTTEKELEKERAMKQAEIKAKKKRMREINRKQAEANREKNK